ncbi:hypothetical protein BDW60DRAFT_72657 [Aspergillus nidulans var. acristatus]
MTRNTNTEVCSGQNCYPLGIDELAWGVISSQCLSRIQPSWPQCVASMSQARIDLAQYLSAALIVPVLTLSELRLDTTSHLHFHEPKIQGIHNVLARHAFCMTSLASLTGNGGH